MTSTLLPPRPPDLGFQAHFHAPPVPTAQLPASASSPSLDVRGHNSRAPTPTHCPDARWLLAICNDHANERWISRPCKRRTCPVCGVRRRKKVAWRIAHGLELLGGEHGGGWFVGTWPRDISKCKAGRAVARFIARLRRKSTVAVEYASTWETTKRGRLHVNLIIAPWTYQPQRVLARWWQDVGGGPNVWITRVGVGVGAEAAKSREDVAHYFAKREQMVLTGRAANYSRRWPKLPDSPNSQRQGAIHFIREMNRYPWQQPPAVDVQDVQLSLWQETRENEYRHRTEPWCDCFAIVQTELPATVRSPP